MTELQLAGTPSGLAGVVSALRDRLLQTHCELADIAALVQVVSDGLAGTELALSRVSVAILPVHAALDGIHAVWHRAVPDRVMTLVRAAGFLDEQEHVESPLYDVLLTRRPLRRRLSVETPGLQPQLRRLALEGATDYLAVPIPSRSTAAIVFTMATDAPHGWGDEAVERLSLLLPTLGLIVEVLDGERLLDLAASDPLTGLCNRRSLDNGLRQAWSTCSRAGVPISLLYVDVDHFKLYNDHYGHVAGDRCLGQLASAFTASVSRGGDLVARIGGEEFAVLLPTCDAPGAELVAERLRQRVEALRLPHARSKTSDCVTVSVGAATLVPSRGDARERLVAMADRALYQAKSEGRNRVSAVAAGVGAEAVGKSEEGQVA